MGTLAVGGVRYLLNEFLVRNPKIISFHGRSRQNGLSLRIFSRDVVIIPNANIRKMRDRQQKKENRQLVSSDTKMGGDG